MLQMNETLQPSWEGYDELREATTQERTPFYEVACRRYRPGMKVLDIGAGSGDFAQFLGDPEIHLIDANPQTVERLRATYPNTKLHTIPEPLPFVEGSFDLIHCSHLIEHLQPHEVYALIQEVDRCLARGGFFVVSAPLLWRGFYNDLSHVRPYNPEVFRHYLCGVGAPDSRTRAVVATDYRAVELKYRYCISPVPYWTATWSRGFIHRRLFALVNWLRRRSVGQYEVTGYTLVLQKPDVPSP